MARAPSAPVFSRRSLGVGRASALASSVAILASCRPFDTTRVAPPEATLGDDMYGVLCDRLGASVLPEDVSGASFQSVCHYDGAGVYGDLVDQSVLPPPATPEAVEARRLSVAKLERLAARRSEVIQALNALFPDTDIPDVTTPEPGDTVRLHDALFRFTQSIVPLYDQNPYEAGGEPLFPRATRALTRVTDELRQSPAALESLASIWGRRGYRPERVGLGIVQPVLAYPKLRSFTQGAVKILGAGGNASPALQGLLAAVQKEMEHAKPTVSPLPDYAVAQATAQPNRPRSAIELISALALAQDGAFAKAPSDPPRYIAARDRRGFVIPLGSTPGVGGLQAPFVDANGDGYADLDVAGRFVDASGSPLPLDPPFLLRGVTQGPTDELERPLGAPYQYLDTTRAMTGALARTLVPLLDATKVAGPGEPEPWLVEHETLMYALTGAYALFGDREPATYDFDEGKVLPAGSTCASCLPYQRFRGEDSPFVELAHAAGQLLADRDSDALLQGLIDLVGEHEDVVARAMGAMLEASDIAQAHDALAEQGLEPKAGFAYAVPIWDEVAQVVSAMAERPGLVSKLVAATGNPTLAQPVAGGGGVQHLGDSLARFASLRDRLDYDKNDLNGPAKNLTIGGFSTADPSTPVSWNAPRTGDNLSLLERSMRVIRDANRLVVCNKPGTKVRTKIGALSLTYPLFGGTIDACGLFRFENMGAFYLGTLLPESHPKRAEMALNEGTLNSLLDVLGAFVDPNDVFEQSSGITGFTLKPTPEALSRFVFFGASSSLYPNMPDEDLVNADSQTNAFIRDVIEPASTSVCPKNALGVHQCASGADTLRLRDPNSMFAWERFGFHDYLRPLLTVFANEACTADLSYCDKLDFTGEQFFLDLASVLYRHWPGPDHGPECDKSGSPQTNPRYCSEAGGNLYEPILKDVFESDLIPAVVRLSGVAATQSKVTVARGPSAGDVWSGADVMEKLVRVLFSQPYSLAEGVVDRAGSASAKWVDGSFQPQATPFSLLADAFHGIDQRFEAVGDPTRRSMWKVARSQLVDELLAVDGVGENAHFRNRAAPRMLVQVLKLLREQLNANCPDRETTGECAWARRDLGDKLAEALSGPLFAGLADLVEAVRQDDTARRELGRLLGSVLVAATDGGFAGDLLHATLSTMSDVLQVLQDDAVLSPIVQALSEAAAPAASPDGPGAADMLLQLLRAISDDAYDPYHVLETVLPAAVTPLGGSGPTPVQVLADVFVDVHRLDAEELGPFEPDDYAAVLFVLREFLASDTRGLEQFYAILEKRPK